MQVFQHSEHPKHDENNENSTIPTDRFCAPGGQSSRIEYEISFREQVFMSADSTLEALQSLIVVNNFP
jgi:hypothetical protein